MRIVLADDHHLVRQCLRICLSTIRHIEVVGEAANGRDAIEQVQKLMPDALVVDISMPELSGIEVAQRISSEFGERCRVVVLSMHGDREFVTEAFRAGVCGYVVKSAAYEELVRALDVVMGGNTYVSPSVANTLVDTLRRAPSPPPPAPSLSSRELEVLRAIAEGQHTKAIAAELGLSDKTVHAMRARIMKKLNLQSVAELTRYALRQGLISLS